MVDRGVVTTTGITASMPVSLTLIEAIAGRDKAEEEDFLRIIEGKQNMLTAGLQGRVRLCGDLALAKFLHGLQPEPS